jgi:FkbM family methyltransferase
MSGKDPINAAVRVTGEARALSRLLSGGGTGAVGADVARAYLTHLPPALTRGLNALLGTEPVLRRLRVGAAERELWYRPGTTDLRVVKQVLVGGEYSAEGTGLDLAGVREVVDLGSNIGVTAALWSVACPQARVLCVEPEPSNFALLERNLDQLNRALGAGPDGRPRFAALRVAVSGEAGRLRFYRASAGRHWASSTDASIAGSGAEAIEVEAVTVPDLLARAGMDRADLLKVDIEGAERTVLPGMASWPVRPRAVVAELHGAYGGAEFTRDVSASGLRAIEPAPGRPLWWAVAC